MYFITYPNAWIIELILSIAALSGLAYLSYLMLKLAIRNGINESKISDSSHQKMAPYGYKWVLVKDE